MKNLYIPVIALTLAITVSCGRQQSAGEKAGIPYPMEEWKGVQGKTLEDSEPYFIGQAKAADGSPNVVPIGAKKVLDDETILISDQYFNKTLANLKNNPLVALTFWDAQTAESYQIKGTITIETSGEIFEKTAAWIDEMARARNIPLKSKGALVVKITDIFTNAPGPDAGSKIG